MQAISIQFPELNPLWLLLGQGEMLLPNEKKEGEQRHEPGELPSSELLAKLLEEANNEKVAFAFNYRKPAAYNRKPYGFKQKSQCPDGGTCRMCKCRLVFGRKVPKY